MKLDISAIATRVASACVVNRTPLFIMSTVVSVVMAIGLLNTQFDGTFNALLTESDPYLDELVRMDEEFPIPTDASFIFIAGDGETVFNHRVLAALNDLRASYETIPTASYLSTIVDWISPETQARLFTKSVENYTEAEFAELA
ncbi:MAG: hypothetical protein MI746_08150, partial [Pseudomonadales bacterium]|nr:hypothetical protein [Pseudomonadales bacterium]